MYGIIGIWLYIASPSYVEHNLFLVGPFWIAAWPFLLLVFALSPVEYPNFLWIVIGNKNIFILLFLVFFVLFIHEKIKRRKEAKSLFSIMIISGLFLLSGCYTAPGYIMVPVRHAKQISKVQKQAPVDSVKKQISVQDSVECIYIIPVMPRIPGVMAYGQWFSPETRGYYGYGYRPYGRSYNPFGYGLRFPYQAHSNHGYHQQHQSNSNHSFRLPANRYRREVGGRSRGR